MTNLALQNQNCFSGNIAPDFKLLSEEGTENRLSNLLKKSPVMLVFYPADFTYVCSKQLCAYQNAKEKFAKYNIQVVGISTNLIESHSYFKAMHKFDFNLLSDPNRDVFKNYGVTSLFMLGGKSRRISLLIKMV